MVFTVRSFVKMQIGSYIRLQDWPLKPLTWKCLRIIYDNKTSSDEEILCKYDSACMHHKNLPKFVIEIYKVPNGLCHEVMNQFFRFQIQNHRNLRNNSTFRIPYFDTVFKGKKSVSYHGPKMWSQVPDEIKSLESLRSFKKVIKKWVPPKWK